MVVKQTLMLLLLYIYIFESSGFTLVFGAISTNTFCLACYLIYTKPAANLRPVALLNPLQNVLFDASSRQCPAQRHAGTTTSAGWTLGEPSRSKSDETDATFHLPAEIELQNAGHIVSVTRSVPVGVV